MTMQGDLALMHANGATFAQVLDRHAHLLAAKIRQRCMCGSPSACVCLAAVADLADDIDPEVITDAP